MNDEQLSDDKLYDIIGKNIKYYRNLYSISKQKMTQETLAEKINVSTALIGNLESSRIHQGISIITLWKISQTLETPIEKFFQTPMIDRQKE